MALTDKLTAVADAIRSKTGTTDPMTLDAMAEAVEGLEVGGGEDYLAQLCNDTLTEYKSYKILTDQRTTPFCNSKKLQRIELPNMYMIQNAYFRSCTSLKDVLLPKLESAINADTFNGCTALESISLPLCEKIGSTTFKSCTSLVNVDLPLLEYVSYQSMYSNTGSFYGCTALESISLPSCTNMGYGTFYGCTALKNVDLPLVEIISNGTFYNCSSLKTIRLPKVTNIDYDAFFKCCSLTAVLIEQSDSVCTLYNSSVFSGCYHILGTVNSTYNPDGLKDGYIYVPDALVEDYKAASGWSTYASQIKPLSEYVEA